MSEVIQGSSLSRIEVQGGKNTEEKGRPERLASALQADGGAVLAKSLPLLRTVSVDQRAQPE